MAETREGGRARGDTGDLGRGEKIPVAVAVKGGSGSGRKRVPSANSPLVSHVAHSAQTALPFVWGISWVLAVR